MGDVVNFRDNALIELRGRVAALGEANADLVAFARGHSGAVAQIHAAALSALDAEGLDHLIHIITQDWPDSLGLDAEVIALSAGERAVRAGTSGVQMVAPRSEEHTSELQSLMRISYAVFCLKKNNNTNIQSIHNR